MHAESLIEIWFRATFGADSGSGWDLPGWRWRLHAGDGHGWPTGDVLIPAQPFEDLGHLAMALGQATGPHPTTNMVRLPVFAARPAYCPQARSWNEEEVLVGDFGRWRLVEIRAFRRNGAPAARP